MHEIADNDILITFDITNCGDTVGWARKWSDAMSISLPASSRIAAIENALTRWNSWYTGMDTPLTLIRGSHGVYSAPSSRYIHTSVTMAYTHSSELAWVGTAALWGAKLVGVYARALQRGGLLQHTNLKLEIFRIDGARGTILFYFLIVILGTIWGILVESLIVLISPGIISLIILEVEVGTRHTIVIVWSIVVIRIISKLVSILIRIPVIWIIWTILIGRAITLLSIVATIVPRLLSLPIVAISRWCVSVVIVPPGCRLFKVATTILRGRPRPLSGLVVAPARFWRTAIATVARI